jgi:excisionase family DNA binding protein
MIHKMVYYVPVERWFHSMEAGNEKWSSIDELSKHLQVHKDTIRLWIKKGDIPAHKIGKLWRFKISEVDEWVRSGKSADVNRNAK